MKMRQSYFSRFDIMISIDCVPFIIHLTNDPALIWPYVDYIKHKNEHDDGASEAQRKLERE